MPTVKEWYCPPEGNSILKELQAANKQATNQQQLDNTPTQISSTAMSIAPLTSREVIAIVGRKEIISLSFGVKHPVLSLETVGIELRMDNSVYKNSLLAFYMFLREGQRIKAKFTRSIYLINNFF